MASKIYITSGLGPAAANEGFTEAYDLPNATAYAETCASVALIFWAQRMLHLDLDGRYADMLELALYNNALCGLSRDGEHYFYSNPLDSDGRHERWAWHTCPCCTMNASRLIASVGGYFLSTSDDAIALHLYGGIAATVAARRRQGRAPRDQHLSLVRRDPHRGHARDADRLRPEAAHPRLGPRRDRDGERRGGRRRRGDPRGYLTIDRRWQPGDTVTLDLPMPPERLYAHPAVAADVGRVALRRGPLVYCVEEADNPGGPVQRLRLPRDQRARDRADAPICSTGSSR